MGLQERYEARARELLSDKSICPENRSLFAAFFEFEERKLKRQNGIAALDIPCYKTLYKYVSMLRNVNEWFRNKPWQLLTREDIQQVYDDLEEDRIKGVSGRPIKDRSGYYSKVFKSKPFRLAGKAELAREIIEYTAITDFNPRFVTEDGFRQLISVLNKPEHLLLFWLQWDIGENIGTLLQLTKNDFLRQVNPQTQEPEYLVHLPRGKLKRSRQSRSEPTLYSETVQYADIVLAKRQDYEPIFHFGHRQALKLMQSVVRKTGAKCQPHQDNPTWKDLRSGMACHLLKSGWQEHEVNARLGHTPGSKALKAYINYLALDRHKPKEQQHYRNLAYLEVELEKSRQRERLLAERLERQGRDLSLLQQSVQSLLAKTSHLTAPGPGN